MDEACDIQSHLNWIRLDESPIWIYGKGGTGIRTANVLKEAGVAVCGFIDKRAGEMSEDVLPSITLEKASALHDKNKAAIIICLKDVFQHEAVARELLAAGFHWLIYKPAASLSGRVEAGKVQQINAIYESLVECSRLPASCDVPRTENIPVHLDDKFLIEDCGETVLAWVPVELIFNYEDSPDYPGCNMPLMFGLVDLYCAFLGELTIEEYETAIRDFYLYCGEWLHKNSLSAEEKPFSGFQDSRAGIFQNMEKMAELNTDFFRQNAPAASYKEGKFYLTSSGRNRVAYQIAKGGKYVPLRLSMKDYVKWCDLPRVRQLEHKLSEGSMGTSFASAAHPYLVSIPCEFADYMRLFILPSAREILRNLYLQCVVMDERGIRHVDFAKFEEQRSLVRIVDGMDDDGVLSRYFQSLGFHVVNSAFDGGNFKDNYYFLRRELKERPQGHGYYLCEDKLPDWCSCEEFGGRVMFVARGQKHRYYGVKT